MNLPKKKREDRPYDKIVVISKTGGQFWRHPVANYLIQIRNDTEKEKITYLKIIQQSERRHFSATQFKVLFKNLSQIGIFPLLARCLW